MVPAPPRTAARLHGPCREQEGLSAALQQQGIFRGSGTDDKQLLLRAYDAATEDLNEIRGRSPAAAAGP